MSKKKIYLEDIIDARLDKTYCEIYDYIKEQIQAGELVPIKSSKTNGKTPPLVNAYWKIIEDADYSDILQELQYRINTTIDVSYYIKNPQKYVDKKQYVQLMSNYLDHYKDNLLVPITINERSFEIFHNEKFIDRNGGREFLSTLGLSDDKLNFYETSEPMSYYSHHKQSPQIFLIIENKDTFYSMRRHLIQGNNKIMGLEVGTLVYGSGKGVYRTFDDYVKGVEPYFNDDENQIYYFGDLDYEGILIYETLCKKYNVKINLFCYAYEKMLEKGRIIGFTQLPIMKVNQNQNIGTLFLNQFLDCQKEVITDLLRSGHYIPQEIVNELDY